MQTTKNYNLKKPGLYDLYNIKDFNYNADTIDEKMKEISNAAYDAKSSSNSHITNRNNPHGVTKDNVGLGNVPNVSTNNQTPTYTVASQHAALVSGETLSTAMGKIAKSVNEVGQVSDSLIANGNHIVFDYHDGKYGINTDPDRGADTFIPFLSGSGGVLEETEDMLYPSHLFQRKVSEVIPLSNITTITIKKEHTTPLSSDVKTIDLNRFGTIYGYKSGTSLIIYSPYNKTKMHYDSYEMFYGMTSLTTLDLSVFDTSNVLNMSRMFFSCKALTTLDLSGFDTSNVTDMNFMFYQCEALTTLDLSSFDTSNVTDMRSMFGYCKSLATLDLSSFDTTNTHYMTGMFSYCSNLTSIDISNFDNINTSNIIDINSMFSYCSSLITIYASDKFASPSKIAYSVFTNCNKLVGAINFSSSKTSSAYANCTNGYFTYKGAGENYPPLTDNITTLVDGNTFNERLNSIVTKNTITSISFTDAIPNLNTTKVYLDEDETVYGQADGTNVVIYCPYEKVKLNADSSKMFDYCVRLTSLDLSNFDTSNVTNMNNMFYNCQSLTSLDLSNFDTSNVTNMELMFFACSSLTSLDVSNFNTSNVTNMTSMFNSCKVLTSLDVSNFNTSNVTNMYGMFSACNKLTSLDVSNFNTSNVTNMTSMFNSCKVLTKIDASELFNTDKVTSSSYMFSNCSKLSGAISYNSSKVDKTYANYTDGYFTYKPSTI